MSIPCTYIFEIIHYFNFCL